MKNFRLQNFKIEDNHYQTKSISLINNLHDNKTNHFTLVIGNNGTGKSRLLGSITRALIGQYKAQNESLYFFSNYESEGELKKVISVSNSLSDKFPLDRAYRSSDISYKDEFYVYLGTRGRMGATSRNLIRRAIDIFLENYNNKNISKCYRHVFDYLDYRPNLTLEYGIKNNVMFKKQNVTPEDLHYYINSKKNYTGLNSSIYSNLEEKFSHMFPEICDFINNTNLNYGKTFRIDVDFSYSNINKLQSNNSKYEEDIKVYEYLNILRRLNLVRDFNVTLYKKDNSSFHFADASSGESNILSTLIALVPLVENNSCILIDEPEISLHPSWQYKYIELLNKIFENFNGCHIIIASHSHFIVSDLPSENSSVVILRYKDGIVDSELFDEATYGWSAEDILLNVFNLPTSRNYFVAQIVTEALELLGKKEKKTEKFKRLKTELGDIQIHLKDEDPLKLIITSILNA
ncbi:ATP-binding protein [Chryseobacterium sp. LC2016-29]|uniref:AAA family ATPase n=1 Tax=Chryseobacterium sp. LC2016-29 TaxID=2897331 RepID=UPI001E2C9380|nr:AAA family ATPase [Chryseobacterium sp. LC2016-29]MCD0480811.1 ATP-binding protein [Chryseobacterium sp. LC2016-29]